MLRLRLADYRYGLLFMLQAGAEESERQGRKKRGGGDLHTHLWWAVISWPYSPASQEGERFRLLLEHLGGRLNSGQVGVLQPQPAGAAEKPLPLPLLLSLSLCLCVCVGVWNACLPVFIVAAQAAVRGVLLGCGRHSLCLVSSADITPKGCFWGKTGVALVCRGLYFERCLMSLLLK